MVVGPSDEPGIGPVVWGSDGARGDMLTCTGEDPFIRMEGAAVFRWATTSLAPVVREACARAGVEVADLQVVVFHQANARIIDSVVRALQAHRTTSSSPTTSSTPATRPPASIPLALARVLESGQVESGSLCLLLGFGAGLNFAGQVVASRDQPHRTSSRLTHRYGGPAVPQRPEPRPSTRRQPVCPRPRSSPAWPTS